MQICIMIVGTHGDVAPFVGIGKRLQKDGHRVRLATHATYRGFVMKNGLEFYPLAGDPKALSAYMVKTCGHIVPLDYEILTKDAPKNLQMVNDILRSTWPAVSAPDPEGDPRLPPFRAQAIISNPVTYGHIHVAEKLGVPLHIMFPQPWVPTEEFPHPLSNLPYRGRREKRNAMSYHGVDALMWTGTEGQINSFRQEVLGLTKIRKGDGGRSMLLDWKIPHSFMWSEHLVPCPPDWDPQLYDVIGTVTESVNATSSFSPSDEFAAFLSSGPAPIFVGFGSMVIPDPAKTTQIIIDAANAANVRVVIQSSWSDMTNGGSIQIPSNVFVLGNCPHDWLFPKMAAVVHHGGAGTTAAGLLAGKPTFIVPFFGDQPFWGWAVENAKVGVHPCPLANLKVDVLRQAFTQLLSPEVIANARALQAKMQREDGIENAVQSFYRHLPNMQCALTPEHLATKWLKQDKIQVCDGCALVLRSRSNQPIEDYRPVQYGIFSPSTALDGVSKGAGVFFHEIGGAVKDMFVEPTKGYMKDGMKGAGIGAVKGIGSMVYRPLNGVAQFVNRVAIGAQNEKAAEQGKEKHRLFEMNKLTNWVTGGDTKTTAPMVNVSLSEDDRAAVQAAFLAARANRPATAVQENVTPSPPSNSTDTAHKDEGEDEEEDASPSKYIQQTSHGTFTMDCVDPELRLKRETAFARTRKNNRKAIVNDTWEDRSVPFSMSVALLVVGLPSDVESFVAIAKALEFDGHRVRLAAARRFEAFITSQGIEYVPLEGNPTTGQERLATASAGGGGAPWQGLFGQDKKSDKKLDTPWSNDEAFAASAWQAVKGADFRADLIVSHPDVMIHLHLAERLGVPLHLLSGIPYSPTADMPHPLVETMTHEDELSNWFSYSEVHKFIWNKFSKTANKLRVKHLNLPAWNAKAAPPSWWQWHIPVSYYWSSLLLSKREDWGDEVEVVGFVQLPDDQVKFEPRLELADFAARKGSYRVYLSLPAMDPNVLISMAEALVASHPNVQVIIGQDGDKNRQMLLSYRLLVVDASTPLKWLIKHTHAVIHQANDPRLLAEILHQNKPSVAVPITAMERQWSKNLREMDAEMHFPSVPSESFVGQNSKLEELVQVLIAKVEAETPSFWSPEVMTESKQAIRRTVSSIYKHLPIEAMQCDVIPSKIAHVYDPVMKMKFSHEAAYVASQHESNKVEMYTPLIYSLNEPPQVAIKAAAGRPAKAESAVDAVVQSSIAAVTRPGLSSQKSVANIAINTSSFWKTQLDETEFRKRVNEGYDKLQATRLAPKAA